MIEIRRDFKVTLTPKDVKDALIAFIKHQTGQDVPESADFEFVQQSQQLNDYGVDVSWVSNRYPAYSTRDAIPPPPPDGPLHRGRGPYGTNPDDKNIVDRDHPDFDMMYSDFGPK